jgi:hypothetical protein
MARQEQEIKKYLSYIKEEYPEVYGSKTTIEVSPYLTEQEKEARSKGEGAERRIAAQSLRYRFIVPDSLRDKDDRKPHWRAITQDGYVTVYEKTEDAPEKIRSLSFRDTESFKFDVDLNTAQGLLMLAFWIEHQFGDVYGMDNPFLTKPLFTVKIRGNVIHHDFELINENGAIYNEIIEMASLPKAEAAMEISNLCAFLDHRTTGKTLAELVIDLLGKKMDGIAYVKRGDYRRYKALTTDEKEIEIAVNKAIHYKFIQNTSSEGFKLDDGTPLGASKASVINYFAEKKAAYKKLMERVQVRLESDQTISDVEEIVANPSNEVRQTQPRKRINTQAKSPKG